MFLTHFLLMYYLTNMSWIVANTSASCPTVRCSTAALAPSAVNDACWPQTTAATATTTSNNYNHNTAKEAEHKQRQQLVQLQQPQLKKEKKKMEKKKPQQQPRQRQRQRRLVKYARKNTRKRTKCRELDCLITMCSTQRYPIPG